jgi:hypothetical protein
VVRRSLVRADVVRRRLVQCRLELAQGQQAVHAQPAVPPNMADSRLRSPAL